MADRTSTLVMFGATGDLARRMLLPSLYGLDSDGLLPDNLRIIGTARTALDDAAFRERADAALKEHLPDGRCSLSAASARSRNRSEEHTSELQSQSNLVCRRLLEKKNVNPCTLRSVSAD